LTGLVASPVGTFALEACPFETVIVDVTHRCNMACANCYIPNRSIPDLDADWILSRIARLPGGPTSGWWEPSRRCGTIFRL